jgi:hypothetical protein
MSALFPLLLSPLREFDDDVELRKSDPVRVSFIRFEGLRSNELADQHYSPANPLHRRRAEGSAG